MGYLFLGGFELLSIAGSFSKTTEKERKRYGCHLGGEEGMKEFFLTVKNSTGTGDPPSTVLG
jgi:hypothetical protein